jgi:predicted ATPase
MIYLKSIHLPIPSLAEGYPYNSPAIRYADSIVFDKPVTFLIGENGCGKSTFLESLMVTYNNRILHQSTKELFNHMILDNDPEDGINLLASSLQLVEKATPRDYFFFRAESFFNYAHSVRRKAAEEYRKYPKSYMLESFGGKSLLEQSHGESFLNTFLNYREYNTLFILDEPESALSPQRQLTLLTRIHQLVQQNCQLIIATHSPILITYPEADIYQIDNSGVERVEYNETELYNLTRTFLNDPNVFLNQLLR